MSDNTESSNTTADNGSESPSEERPPEKRGSAYRSKPSPSPLRPYVLGATAVFAVLGSFMLLVGGQTPPDPEAVPVTAGEMRIADASPEGGGDAAVPDVHFYEVLEQGDDVTGLTEQAVATTHREMPLPPPAVEGVKTPQAKKTAPETVAQSSAPMLEQLGVPVATQDVADRPSARPAAVEEAPRASAGQPKTAQKGAASAPEAAPAPAEPKPYTLQVAAFSQMNAADEQVARLKQKGFDAYSIKVDLGRKGTWYRVRVGRYESEHAAKWARLDLVKAGLTPIVVKAGDTR